MVIKVTSFCSWLQMQEGFLAPTFVKDEQKHRRPFEFEMERDTKQRTLEQLVASHPHPPIVLNGWRDAAVDLSRVPDGPPGSSSPFSLSTSIPKLGTVNALQGSLGMDLSGILQAGLIHPVTGQIVNGSLRRDDAAMRRRRGRRKNVEGIDLIFLKERSLQTGLPVSNSLPGFLSLPTCLSLNCYLTSCHKWLWFWISYLRHLKAQSRERCLEKN